MVPGPGWNSKTMDGDDGTMHPVNLRNWGHFMYGKWWVKLGLFFFATRDFAWKIDEGTFSQQQFPEIREIQQLVNLVCLCFSEIGTCSASTKKMRTGDLRSTLPDVAWMPWTCIITNLPPLPPPRKTTQAMIKGTFQFPSGAHRRVGKINALSPMGVDIFILGMIISLRPWPLGRHGNSYWNMRHHPKRSDEVPSSVWLVKNPSYPCNTL